MTHTARRRAELGLTLPKPGSVGLSRIGGLLGKLIAAGQAFSGDGSRFTHAFLVLDNGDIIEALPGGARIGRLSTRLADPEVRFSDRPIQGWLTRQRASDDLGDDSRPPLSTAVAADYWAYVEHLKRQDVASVGRSLENVHYGYLQYLYLGLYALGVDWGWLKGRITQRGSMICSQLVDDALRRAGIHLFEDHRLPQEVTPGDLAHRLGVA